MKQKDCLRPALADWNTSRAWRCCHEHIFSSPNTQCNCIIMFTKHAEYPSSQQGQLWFTELRRGLKTQLWETSGETYKENVAQDWTNGYSWTHLWCACEWTRSIMREIYEAVFSFDQADGSPDHGLNNRQPPWRLDTRNMRCTLFWGRTMKHDSSKARNEICKI